MIPPEDPRGSRGTPAVPAGAIDTAIDTLPRSLQGDVRNWFERVDAERPGFAATLSARGCDVDGLVRVLACSEFAGSVLLRHRDWFLDACATGRLTAPTSADLEASFERIDREASDRDAYVRAIRQLRNRTLVRILWADLVGECELDRVLSLLSDLADCAIRSAVEVARRSQEERYGDVVVDGRRVPLVVLGMGKLGGRELNFSSDIDLVFLYPDDGETSGRKAISAHEFFARVARSAAALLEEVTEEGFVFRVDTRLRPFGDSGPPVLSFGGLERYLLEHGRSWERYAYIKARIVAPSGVDELERTLTDAIIRPFVYRRYLDYGVFEALREMKALVAAEVAKREMAGNVKLGPGGIREIEFIVQAMQLLRGGNVSGLRTTGLRSALRHAVDDRDLNAATAARLLEAYEFLRRVENCLQAVRDQQTHELPTRGDERERLAYAMRFDGWQQLSEAITSHRDYVSEQFAAVAFRGGATEPPSSASSKLRTLWSNRAPQDEWRELFAERAYEDPDGMAETVVGFANRPSTRRVDSAAARRLAEFIPKLLGSLTGRSRPADVLGRVLNILDQVLRRSAYIALLNENRLVLDRLVELCATSRYLADEIARFPALLDELIDARRYATAPTAAEIRTELAQRARDADPDDSERQVEILAEFKRASLFRLAVADFSGSVPVMKVSDRLTEIAELVLSRSLALARADMVARAGEPRYVLDGRRHIAEMGIVAYGKLGGMELSYGSDLDLVFLHDSRGEAQQTDGDKPLDNSVFFARLARRLVHFLTTQTASGVLYQVDTRLRPSGRSGLLVTSIEAFERYQDENAWTWEHQALLRARAVAGGAVVEREFERIRVQTLRDRVHRDRLREDVISMRRKMRRNLDKSSGTRFDLKQGGGGIADIEFLVQYLVLANAAAHPAVVHFSDNIRQLGVLAAAGCLAEAESRRLQDIYKSYRELTHRLSLDRQPAIVPGDAFLSERRFVGDLWRRTLGDATAGRE